MKEVLLKSGEFAKLCGVKKDTLLHYEQIGILMPQKVGENGYRYYELKQLRTFDLIAMLKHLGMSLGEIRLYMNARNPAAYLSLLKQQQERLADELQALARLQKRLGQTISETEYAQQMTAGQVVLEDCPAQQYIALPAADYRHYEEQAFLLQSRALQQLVAERGHLSLPVGDIVSHERLRAERYVEDYYYCPISSFDGEPGVSLRPAGLYAVLYHEGSYESLEGAYKSLMHWVAQNGYRYTGHLYEEEIFHFLSTKDPARYRMRISVAVEREKV